MAQNIGDAQISLSVNTSQMEREVSSALRRLESKGFNLGGGINAKAFTQPLGRITGAANEFQKSLDASNARVIAFGASAGAIYNVQRAFTALIGSTIEVQKSLTDINVILNASGKTLSQFGDQLFEIARNSGQAFSTVATAAGELARQGLTIEQTLKRTSDALILARLSGLDAASSVEALTASINSFNQSALDSTQIVNKLASVDAAFAVSSGDLAEALKRVGSSAQDVGVSFDELLAIVASVNQTTARGGAVIGNSLKTIFTRVQRTDVLDQLQALGIAVRDLNGNTAPAIQILTGLAQKFDQLGDAQRSQVAELVGGVFQINILKAALGDLSKEYSVFGNALKISSNASNEATRRNEELNKTLAALLNRTTANLTKIGSEIGSLTLGPAIEKVLGSLNTALESFDFKGDGIGSKIGRGIFEGIGSFVAGPGLALLIGVFIKVFQNLAKFTTDAVKTVLGLNKEAQTQAQLQERINTILAQNPQLVQNILNKQVSLLQVEKDLLTVIQAQAKARQQVASISTAVSGGLISKGVKVDQKGLLTTSRTKSQGFIPNFNSNKEMMGAISGGYMPGQVRSMNIPNYGRITYNDAETVKQFSGLSQPGIMPPADSEAGKAYKEKFKNKYGINPYTSSGFIPNFAASTNRLVNQGYKVVSSDVYTTLSKGDSPFKQYVKGSSAGGYFLDSNVEDKAIQYYKSQTESSVLSRGKGILSKEQVEKTGAVLVYPAFSGGGLGSTTATALKHRGKTTEQSPEFLFSTFGFPGPNGGIGPKLYDNVQKALKEQVYNFIGQATLNPKDLFDDERFDNYVNTNINRSTIEAAVGGVFEAGLKSSIFSAVDNPNAPLDLSAGELKKLSATFKGAEPLAGFSLGEVKNALNPSQANSMADKIASSKGYPLKSKGKTKSLGFVPNFSPIDRALNTEEKMGGRGVLDFKPGLGLYVRDGKTQPNFAAVMRDHPEGIGNAIQNSKKMQSMMSAGFIPNMIPIVGGIKGMYQRSFGASADLTKKLRPTLSAKSLVAENVSNQNIQSLQRAIDKITKSFDKGSIDVAQATQKISNRLETYTGTSGRKLSEAQNKISATLNNRESTLSKGVFGTAIGALGNLNTRIEGSKLGKASAFLERKALPVAFAASIVGETAGNLLGGEKTRAGRTTTAALSGIGDIASYASIGSLFGPIGTAVGATAGVISAGSKVFKAFNDKTFELSSSFEIARENLNQMTSAVQNINTASETLDNFASGNFGGIKDPEAIAKIRLKAENQLAEGISKLDPETKNQFLKARSEGRNQDAQVYLTQALQKAQETASKKERILSLNELEKSGVLKDATAEGIKGYSARTKLQAELSPILKDVDNTDLQRLQSAGSKEQIESILQQITKSTGIEDKEAIEFLANILFQNKKFVEEQVKLNQTTKETQILLREQEKNRTQQLIKDLPNLQNRYNAASNANERVNLGAGVSFKDIFNSQDMQTARAEVTGGTITKYLTTLGTEFNNSAKATQLMSEFHSEAAKIADEFNTGLISATEAAGRMKLKFDEIQLKIDAKNLFSDELASRASAIRSEKVKLEGAGGFDPASAFLQNLGDNGKTTIDKLNKSFENLAKNMQTGFEDAFGAFFDGTKTAEDAFTDMMQSLSQQIIKEQFSIGMRSLLGGLTGGGNFGIGGDGGGGGGGGLLGGIFNTIFGGGKAKGGLIKKYSGGGYVNGGSGVRDDVPAMLTDGEYVLRKSAVNKYGKGMLDMLNSGGMVKGYAGGGGIEDRGIRGADRSASVFIKSLFSRGNDVSSYLNDRFLQANNRMVFRGGKGGDMLSKPVPFTASLPGGIPVSGKALHATPYFQQAAGYANNSLNIPFKNVAGKPFTVSGSTGNLPLASRANMVQSFYGLEDALVTRGSVYAQAIGEEVSGIKVKDFLNARVSDRVLDNLSLNEKALVSMTEKDGLELNPMGGRKGQAFLTKGSSGRYIEAINMPGFLRKQIDKEIKYAKISSPDYMSKAQRGAYFDSLSRAKSARGLGAASTFFEDLNLASKFNNIGKFGGSLLKTGGRMFGMAGGAFGNLDLFDQAMGELGFFPGGGSNSMSRGGRIKGYASGGSVSSMLNNSYDFFGAKGEKLTQNYTSEAFNTTVNSPEELANIPALTGKFNISDMLSSRAITDENNPMNALRDQRFLGMQNYQQQVSNFKTGYNEQYRQVEEARAAERERVNKINSEMMSQYNRSVSQRFIGGLFSVGLGIAGGALNSGLSGLGGGGGGGLAGFGFFGDLLKTVGGSIFEGLSSRGSGGFGDQSDPKRAAAIAKQQKEAIEQSQLSGFSDPYARRNQIFPQYGSQTYGYAGSPFTPVSSVGGFQYNVGLGTPAGFQTRTQTTQDFYNVLGSSPTPPISSSAITRGVLSPTQNLQQLMYLSNPNVNPFGYAKGGRVKGYRTGAEVKKQAFVDQNYPIAFLIAQQLGTTPEAVLAQFAVESGYGMSGLARSGFNLGGIQAGKGYKGETITLPANADEKARGEFSPNVYRKYKDLNEFAEDFTQFLKKPRYKEALGVTDVAKRADILARQGYAGDLPEGVYAAKVVGAAKALRSYLPQARSTSPISIDPEGIAITGGGPKGPLPPIPQVSTASLPPALKRQVELGFLTQEAAEKAMRSPQVGVNIPFLSGSTTPTPAGTKAPVTFAGAVPQSRRNIIPSETPQKNYQPFLDPKDLKELFNFDDPERRNIPLFRNASGAGPGIEGLIPSETAQAAQQAIAQQTASQQYPWEDIAFQLQTYLDETSSKSSNLYKSVGSLYDMKNKGDYGRLASKFSSFYGNNLQNRYTPFGEKGFNNYLKYIGASPFSSMSSLNSFKFPMTPNTYSPFAFGSQNFGGFGGSGYQSGFSSTGNAFSNYFSTGSRLGITPSWASRANGGMIYGGTSAKDDVPAMLMGGEYVIRKNIVDKMGEPFFNRLNRGQVQGFAEGGPVGTNLPSVGGGTGDDQQDKSRSQFVESISKLVKSLEQLNKGVEEQNRTAKEQGDATTASSDTTSGVTNNININVNVDQNGKTTDSTTEEGQSGESSRGEESDQEKFKKAMERSRVLAELLRQQVLKVIVEEQRPGGVLYQGSKGRDMGR